MPTLVQVGVRRVPPKYDALGGIFSQPAWLEHKQSQHARADISLWGSWRNDPLSIAMVMTAPSLAEQAPCRGFTTGKLPRFCCMHLLHLLLKLFMGLLLLNCCPLHTPSKGTVTAALSILHNFTKPMQVCDTLGPVPSHKRSFTPQALRCSEPPVFHHPSFLSPCHRLAAHPSNMSVDSAGRASHSFPPRFINCYLQAGHKLPAQTLSLSVSC